AALKAMGVPVIKSLKKKHHSVIKDWIEYGKIIPVDYPDVTEEIINLIIARHYKKKAHFSDFEKNESLTAIRA
ncbi:MAG: hypothetical protein ACXVPU_11265, partial [Bacteroidia bacterium]